MNLLPSCVQFSYSVDSILECVHCFSSFVVIGLVPVFEYKLIFLVADKSNWILCVGYDILVLDYLSTVK